MGRRRRKVVHNDSGVHGVVCAANSGINTYVYKIVQGNAVCILRLVTRGSVCVDGQFNVFIDKVKRL